MIVIVIVIFIFFIIISLFYFFFLSQKKEDKNPMNLIVKLNVKDKIEAYKVVSRLGFEHEVLEAVYEDEEYKFNKEKENKTTKNFLNNNFDLSSNEEKHKKI